MKFLTLFSIWALIVLVPLAIIFTVDFWPKNLVARFSSLENFLPIVLAAYLAFAGWAFFYLPEVIMVSRPKPGVQTVAKQELIAKIEKNFTQKDVSDQPLFEMATSSDELSLTWSKNINYNQVMALGGESMKRVFFLHFYDDGQVSLIQRNVDWSWSLSGAGFFSGMSFFQGISFESSADYRPSFSFDQNGNLSFDLKSITYTSSDISRPLEKIITDNGWTLKRPIIENTHVKGLIISAVAFLPLLIYLF